MDNTIKFLALFVVIVVIISAILGSIAVVPAGNRGVLLTYGAVENKILPEGISLITPFVNQVVVMSVQTQKYSTEASSASKDLQTVSTEVTLNYRLDPNTVNKIYQELSIGYENNIIQPAIQEVVKASTAKFTAEELITKREIIKSEIENALRDRLSNFGGIIMQTVSITNFDFSPEFNSAIEAKQTAEQLALKAENDLKRIKVEAEQRVAQATAEAEAIRIQAEALKSNQQLIALNWVERWNGILPTTLIVGGETPTLLLPVNPVNPVQSLNSTGE
jgi:regulator of protease activity HflC (stomatin/prohibitin superfamily)